MYIAVALLAGLFVAIAIVVVSDMLNTKVRNADEIVVLTEDGVAEKGTHDELMKKGGVYSKMYGMYSTI